MDIKTLVGKVTGAHKHYVPKLTGIEFNRILLFVQEMLEMILKNFSMKSKFLLQIFGILQNKRKSHK